VRPSWAASRRARGLGGLVASAGLAAGAITAWAAWTAPVPVRLLPVHPVTAHVSSRPSGRTGLSAASARTSASARTVGSPAPGVPVSPPVALAIPSAGISARVVPEGLGPGGTLDIYLDNIVLVATPDAS